MVFACADTRTHQFFSWMTVSLTAADPGNHRCRCDGGSFAVSHLAECNETLVT
jgi:hypothetical protein